jgi:ribosomal protein S18 acetylase RimI-like enzyme
MIRRAKVADAAIVHAILWEARSEIPLKPNFADDEARKWVRDQCAHKRVWLFERDRVVAGVVVMDETEIKYLATSLAHRRSGVAGALIDDAKAKVWKQYGVPACARTRVENAPVQRLLEKHGFVIDHDKDHLSSNWIWFKTTEPN